MDGIGAIRDGLGWAGIASEYEFTPVAPSSESFLDPGAAAAMRIPVLALFAENHRQIDPLQGAAAFERLFAAGRHPLSKVVVVAGADHNMNLSPRGCMQDQVDGYRSVGGKKLSPVFLETVSEWLGPLRNTLTEN